MHAAIADKREELAVVVWTPRGDARRIISMRQANEREREFYYPRF